MISLMVKLHTRVTVSQVKYGRVFWAILLKLHVTSSRHMAYDCSGRSINKNQVYLNLFGLIPTHSVIIVVYWVVLNYVHPNYFEME